MPQDLDPLVDQWYWHHDKGQSFVVIAVEPDAIEIQHYDGDIEEMTMATWRGMDIEPAEPPEDWTGPVDDVEPDDLDYSDTGMQRDSWGKRGRDYRTPSEGWANEPGSSDENE